MSFSRAEMDVPIAEERKISAAKGEEEHTTTHDTAKKLNALTGCCSCEAEVDYYLFRW